MGPIIAINILLKTCYVTKHIIHRADERSAEKNKQVTILLRMFSFFFLSFTTLRETSIQHYIIHTRHGNETAMMTITMGIQIIIMQKFYCNLTGTNEIKGETVHILYTYVYMYTSNNQMQNRVNGWPMHLKLFLISFTACTPVVNFNHKFLNESPLTLDRYIFPSCISSSVTFLLLKFPSHVPCVL